MGGKRRRTRSTPKWTHIPAHPIARTRFEVFCAELSETVEEARRVAARPNWPSPIRLAPIQEVWEIPRMTSN